MNLCRRCEQDFSSVEAFDRHRTGHHDLSWPEHEDGRRCADEYEMAEAGLERGGRGRWRIPISDSERERLSALGGSAEKPSERPGGVRTL